MSDNVIQAQTRFDQRLEGSSRDLARRLVVERARETVLPRPALVLAPDLEPTELS